MRDRERITLLTAEIANLRLELSAADAQLAKALERTEAAEQNAIALAAFCRYRVAQCVDMGAQGVPHPGTYREGRIAAFLAVIERLDSALPTAGEKP